MPRRKYHGEGQGVIQTLYIATDNMAWLRERRKSGDSMSGIVNRALLLLRNQEAVSYAADANVEEEDGNGNRSRMPA